MAKKTFISYKYDEAQGLRDKILDVLDGDGAYYQGETADSPNLSDEPTKKIKKVLTDMMYNTSVTIVVVSPNLKDSKWIDWEIEYCLKEITRNERTSQTNGVVGVIQEFKGGYDWLVTEPWQADGCILRAFDDSKLYNIINHNRFNYNDNGFACPTCQSYDMLEASYISLIEEGIFLSDHEQYIDNAFEKSENSHKFNLTKKR